MMGSDFKITMIRSIMFIKMIHRYFFPKGHGFEGNVTIMIVLDSLVS